MSDIELQRIEDAIVNALTKQSSKKASFLNLENILKLGFTLIMGSLAYAGMSYKIDTAAKDIIEVKQNQKDDKKDSDLQRQHMILDIQTCQTRLSIMETQLQNLKEEQKLK